MVNRWLARLSYSFVIIAAVLGYEIYRANTGRLEVPDWQYAMMCVAAVLSLGLGFTGIRVRHRLIREARDSGPRGS